MNFKEYDFNEVVTVFSSKPSIAKYNGSDYIFYSKYKSNHSDIYVIPIVEGTEQIDVLGYSDEVADSWAGCNKQRGAGPTSPFL